MTAVPVATAQPHRDVHPIWVCGRAKPSGPALPNSLFLPSQPGSGFCPLQQAQRQVGHLCCCCRTTVPLILQKKRRSWVSSPLAAGWGPIDAVGRVCCCHGALLPKCMTQNLKLLLYFLPLPSGIYREVRGLTSPFNKVYPPFSAAWRQAQEIEVKV